MRAELRAFLQAFTLSSVRLGLCSGAWVSGAWPEVVHSGTKTACGCLAANLAHTDSVTKCKAHLSKAARARLDETARFMATGNERTDELPTEGARENTFQALLCDWYKAVVETSRAFTSHKGSFILRAKGGERWPDVVVPLRGWGEKDDRSKHVKPTLAPSSSLAKLREMVLRNVWQLCERRSIEGEVGPHQVCWASCSGGGRTRKASATLSCADGQLRVVLQVWSKGGQVPGESLANRVWDGRGLKSMREAYACCRAAGTPKKTIFSDR